MKVIFTMGGVTHYLAPLFKKISHNGIDIVVVLPEQTDNNIIGAGVKLTEQDCGYRIRKSRTKKMYYGKSSLTDLKNIILQEQPDAVVLGWPYMLQLFFERSLLKTLKKNNIKIFIREIPFQIPRFGDFRYYKKHPAYNENMELISSGISFQIKMLITMLIRRYIYTNADAAINYCTDGYKIIPSYGMPVENIFVTFNTTDTETLLKIRNNVIESPPLLKSIPRIIHIGRLVKWKRVDLLLEAFSKIVKKYSEAELMIVGNGPEKRVLEEMSEKLNIKNNTIFTDGVYDPYLLGKYMYESSIYVLAGMGGLSINDAMCYSLPIICSICDGTEKDLVKEEFNGYYFEENNADSLAEKIELLLSDPATAKKFGDNSFDIIINKINLTTVSKNFINAFYCIIK